MSKTISPDIIKDYVSRQLTILTAQPSHINGDISWELFPQPRVKITAIQIGNNSDYTLNLDNLFLNLKITPLLRGKLVFSDLKVDGFVVQIHSDLQLPIKHDIHSMTTHTVNKQINNSFAIEQLLLTHGRIDLVKNGYKLMVTDLQIGAKQINLQQTSFPFQFKANTIYSNSDNNSLIKAQIQFKGSGSLFTNSFANHFALDAVIANNLILLDGQLILQNAVLQTNYHQLKIDKLTANTKIKNHVLQLDPLTISLYQGESIGDLQYDFSKKNLFINQTATGIASSKLTEDLFNKRLFQGKLDLSLHTQADLHKINWQKEMLSNGNISIKGGSIESVNLNKIVEVISSNINTKINQLLPGNSIDMRPDFNQISLDYPEFFTGGTPFKLMTIQYRIDNAILSSEALLLQTERLQLKGNGQLNLNDQSLDIHFLATLTVPEEKINQIQQLLGGSFPFFLQGTLMKPGILPDFKKIHPVLTKLWLKDTLTKPVKKITKHLVSIFH